MAKYKIRLQFIDNPSDGDFANISISDNVFIFDFDLTPSSNEVQIGGDILGTAGNTRYYFENKYNLQGLYRSWVFNADSLEIECDSDTLPVLSSSLGDFSFTTELLLDPIRIINTDIVSSLNDVCGKVNIDVTTSKDTIDVISPYNITNVNSTTFTLIDQLRGSSILITVKDIDGELNNKTVSTPGILSINLIDITVNLNNVSISNNTAGLYLQYSYDQVNWNDTGSFNNLPAGNYTMYIKDNYGCIVSEAFTIEEGTGVEPISEPYFHYSKGNPIRVAKREEWDSYSILKNANNTLSCENSYDDIIYTADHLYLQNDIIQLQFRNNYPDLKVNLSDGTLLSLSKVSNNMGLKDSLDSKVVQLGGGKVGIYFTNGKRYDYDIGNEIGTYDLNGELPDFGIVGNAITVNNFNYVIESESFNYDVNAYVLIISSTITDVDVVTKSIYNLLDYEVYETFISMLNKVLFNFTIYFNGKVQFASELIKIVEDSGILVKIVYSMSKNTDIFFNSGFQGIIRLLIDTNKAGIDNESENYNTDEEFFQINSSNFEVDIFKFLPRPKEVTRQLELILSYDTLSINGIEYVKDTIESEPLERSNLYVVTATMKVKDGDNLSYGDNTLIDIEVISYDGSNFIKTS